MRNTAPDTYDAQEFTKILKDIENRLDDLERTINATPYVVSNIDALTRLRDFDVNTATIADLRRVVGTLITDMQKVGRLA